MNRLEVLFEQTEQLQDVLNQERNYKNRAEIIEQVNQLIEKRDESLTDIKPPYTKEEELLGKKLVQLNTEIEQLMQEIFTELKAEIQQVKKQKRTNRKYINPYEKVNSSDAMFLDSKK
ncbi:flagellar protein FliT [Virgibacillus halodenitrificans]|uniref:flagellar protein FliT n=1 Tax=Virgibacillus halodenitrificans TaxID=1482 RepID=UPI00030ADADE|nr:flagellar protein FliT [Virgibacillus halodenitrificans]